MDRVEAAHKSDSTDYDSCSSPSMNVPLRSVDDALYSQIPTFCE